jgi:hypothetical protein
MKSKQAAVDSLHNALRTTSTQLSDARRAVESLQATLKKQQLARQRVANLSHAREDQQLRLAQDQAQAGRPEAVSGAWETELGTVLEASRSGDVASMLPSKALLRARINAVNDRREITRMMVSGLKGRSRDVEMKYRKLVALSTNMPEGEVEAVVDGLLRAVESEKGDLQLARVQRFLGGVDGVVH